MTTPTTQHRHTRSADRLIGRLQSIILAGADLVAELDDERTLYTTPAGRYFILAGADLHPVTADEARALAGGALP